jgi:large subunit ribosomal protein L6
MKEKQINLSKNIDVSIKIINSKKFLLLKKDSQEKYVLIPSFIQFEKKNNLFYVKNILPNSNTFIFNQFLNRLDFAIKNLTVIFKKKLILKGLGFRIILNDQNNVAQFKLGYSHLITINLPKNIRLKVRKTLISIESNDNILLGNFVNKIVSLRNPDSYKEKGF